MRYATARSSWIWLTALMGIGVLAIHAGAASGDPPRPQVALADLAWLAGHWLGEIDGVRMEEFWLAPAGGVMLGLHRDTSGPRSSFFEYLRIETRDEGPVYLASPRGGETTAFVLLEAGPGRVVFENPQHDYPQRIVYELTGSDSLTARIEGIRPGGDGLEASEWTWRRVLAHEGSENSGRKE